MVAIKDEGKVFRKRNDMVWSCKKKKRENMAKILLYFRLRSESSSRNPIPGTRMNHSFHSIKREQKCTRFRRQKRKKGKFSKREREKK